MATERNAAGLPPSDVSTPDPSSEPVRLAELEDANASPEDLVCLQSAVDELRRGREVLIRRLQAAEGGAHEKVQLAEARLREALAQIDALKRSAQAVRARLEAEVQALRKRAVDADDARQRAERENDELRIGNAELVTALEAAECRLADLETESGVHTEELERLQQQHAADAEQVAAIRAEIAELQQVAAAAAARAATAAQRNTELTDRLAQLAAAEQQQADRLRALEDERARLEAAVRDAERGAQLHVEAHAALVQRLAESTAALANARDQQTQLAARIETLQHDGARERENWATQLRTLGEQAAAQQACAADLARQLDAVQIAHAEELNGWQETASAREAELVAARDDMARRLEEEQSQTCLAREEAATLAERARGLEAAQMVAAQARAGLEEEIAALRAEQQRERALFEAAAREREAEHRRAFEEQHASADVERARLCEQLSGLQCEADRARQQVGRIADELAAAIAERDAACRERDAAVGAVAERLEPLETALRTRNEQVAQLQAEIDAVRARQATELENLTEDARRQRDEWAATEGRLHEELSAARAAAAKNQAFIEAARAQALALEAEIAEGDAQRGRLSRRIVALEEDVRVRTQQSADLTERAADLERQYAATLTALQATHHEELAAARAEVETVLAVAQKTDSQLQTAATELAAGAAERHALADRIAALHAELEAGRNHIDQLTAAAVRLEEQHAAALAQREVELQEARAAVDEHQAAHVDTAQRIAVLEEEVRIRGARIDELSAAAEERDRATRDVAEWRIAYAQLQEHLGTAHAEIQSLQAAAEAAQNQVRAAAVELATRDEELHTGKRELEGLRAAVRERQAALAAIEQRAAVMQEQRDQHAQRAQELEEQLAAALQAQQLLGGQIEDFGNERHDLQIRIDELTALTSQLERESERLRRDRTSAEEVRRYKSEIARLEAKIGETERQHADAAQRHSAAVAGYMVELNQRSEALHARDLELQRLNEELLITRQACEDGVAQLELIRQERADIEQQLNELRAATAGDKGRSPARTVRPGPSSAAPAAAPTVTPSPSQAVGAGAPIHLVHLEDNKAYRDPIQAMISSQPESKYLTVMEAPRGGARQQVLLVNLFNSTHDAFAAIAGALAENAEREVLAYCADGSSGLSLGPVEFFTQPIDPNDIVARILERRGMIQRLLTVSDDVEMTAALRKLLAPMRCSTPSAFDARQAVDLLPMIEPEVVLVDFALPRGEGVRLAMRLRADPKTRKLALAIVLPQGLSAAEFRRHAAPAVREFAFPPDQLARSVAEQLGLPASAVGRTAGAELLRVG